MMSTIHIRHIIFFGAIFYTSCNNGEKPSQKKEMQKMEYYSTGKLKSIKLLNQHGEKEGIAEEFYEGGKLKKRYGYRNDTLNGKFESYFENGEIESKGFFWNGKPVGPTFYYKNNGKIKLYNELDFNGDIYYVMKYDENQKISKEEGVPISPNILINGTQKDSLTKGSSANIIFFYSEPVSYKNTLLCYLDNDTIQVKYIDTHMALIHKQFFKKGIYGFKAVSVLRSADAIQIAKDSIVRKLIVY